MYSSAYVWAKILSSLEERLGAVTISAWLDDAEVVELNENNLILYSPSDFRREIIRRRCTDLIQDALKEIFNSDAKLLVFGDEEMNARKAKGRNPTAMDFNPQFTFDNFVVGPSNRFAHSAAIAVSKTPGQVYNPLFIYGPPGVGKTHLLYAIAHGLKQNHPDAKIVYIKGDDFTNELVASIREGKNAEFREKYRQATLLLVDDVQFIAGKEQTQEEFFHTFNSLYEAGKQIVLTSDRPPREMTKLEDRLRTRFEWGLMVDVTPPDYETRLAIVKNKSAMLGVKLSDPVTDLIAENVTANVRQIEGTLNKILAYYDLMGSTMAQEDILKAIRDMIKRNNEYVPTAQAVVSYICTTYHIDEDVLRGQSRGREVVNARQIAMYLMRRMICMNLADIGKEFGDRDHTTVLHSLDKVEKQMRSDPAFAETVKQITTNINANPKG